MGGSLRSLVDDRGFHEGFVLGVAALVVLTALAMARDARRHRPRAPLRLAGVTAAAAILVASDRTGAQVLLSREVTRGILLLAIPPLLVAAVCGPERLWTRLLALGAAVPGAIVLADASGAHNAWTWVPGLVLVTVLVGGTLATDCDEQNARNGLVPVLLGITAFATWTTVPDTEQILVVVGVLVPMAFLGWPVVRAAHGAAIYGVVGTLAWVAAVGGRGRAGSVVGAVACLGLLLVEPVGRRIWRGRARVPGGPLTSRFVALVAVHTVVVGLCARVAGLQSEATTAALIAGGVLVAGCVATALVLAPWPAGPAPAAARRRSPPPNMDGA